MSGSKYAQKLSIDTSVGTELTRDSPTPPFMISETSSVPIGRKLEGQTKSGSSPPEKDRRLSSRVLRVPEAAGPGHNANEYRLATWDKASQGEFACDRFASTA